MISFTLRAPYPLLNVLLRMHFTSRKKLQRAMAREIAAATFGARPAAPFRRARVTIERLSPGMPDHDGLYGGAKPLLDCLTTPVRAGNTIRNALGLGFVVDDSPEHIELVVTAVRSSRAEACTRVRIEEIQATEGRAA